MSLVTPRDGAVLALASYILYRAARQALRKPLPPGPPGYPLLGNVLDMPKGRMWETFKQWGEKCKPFFLLRPVSSALMPSHQTVRNPPASHNQRAARRLVRPSQN